jgi:hypothetical protein
MAMAMAANGASDKEIMIAGGWRSLKSVEVYAKVNMPSRRGAAGKVWAKQ